MLAEKLKDPQQQISTHFNDYTGQQGSSQDAIEFFKRKFFGLNRNPEKQIYAYPTTATNSENIKVGGYRKCKLMSRSSCRQFWIRLFERISRIWREFRFRISPRAPADALQYYLIGHVVLYLLQGFFFFRSSYTYIIYAEMSMPLVPPLPSEFPAAMPT